jgi:hypothetical protein
MEQGTHTGTRAHTHTHEHTHTHALTQTQDEVELVHGAGDYADHAAVGCQLVAAANIYNPFHGSAVSLDRVPDPMERPAEFANAVADGRINTNIIENCRACVLRVNHFYLQRPPCPNSHSQAFTLVKVVKIIPDTDHPEVQWGAYVELWELATRGNPDCCYFSDPWWACATMQHNTRYNTSISIYNQTWCYEKSELSEFQDGVDLTNRWQKPKGWNKQFNGDPAHVTKRSIVKKDQAKLRTYVMRWADQAADMHV